MKKTKLFIATLLLLTTTLMIGCDNRTPEEKAEYYTTESEIQPWYNSHPDSAKTPDFRVKTGEVRLHFYGWGLQEDSLITVKFPESTDEYERAILTYRMGGWNEGPADWDMTTMIMVKDKNTGKFFEIARAFTPYGGYFNAAWEKFYYMDITEYLPMLTGETEFYIYYGGWDATSKKAHTVQLTFEFYKGKKGHKCVYYEKIYDSRESSNTGYRSWAYGVDSASIEDVARLGERTITVPDDVKYLLMKVSISGHGHDQGKFPDRSGSKKYANNAAEFDENWYTVKINGNVTYKGHIFYDNSNTYRQAGTYKYNRANWGPGLPLKVDYLTINNIPKENREMTIDFDLDNFISKVNSLSGEGLAQYIIEVDVFGFSK